MKRILILNYQQQARNAGRLGRPQAAFDVAELVWAAASS